jgi:HEAT repeat protein
LGDLRAVDVLLSALASDNELERLGAIGALGELADDRALPHLLPFMDSSDWQVRHRLALTLGQFNAPEARAALEILSQDSIAQVSEAAAAQLG